MTDEMEGLDRTNESDELAETVEPLLWAAPNISPTSNSTVSGSFLIKVEGWAVGSVIHKWNVDVHFENNDKYRRVQVNLIPPDPFYSSIEVRIPEGIVPVGNKFYIKAEFQATIYSNWGYSRNLTMAYPRPTKPRVRYPEEGGTLNFGSSLEGDSGYAGAGSRVTLQQSGGHEWAYATPSADGSWRSSPLPQHYGLGPKTLYVRVDKGNEHSEYEIRNFTVKPIMPSVNRPKEGEVLDFGSSFSGTHGYSGAGSVVSIQQEGGHEWTRATPKEDGTWTSTELPHGFVGRHVLHVRVDVGGHHSDYLTRNFSVRPPLPQIKGPTGATSQRPTFNGEGYEGATVEIVQQNYATPVLATATVRNGVWTASLSSSSSDLPPGPYLLSARQQIDGVWSNWLNPPFQISVKPPKLAISVPPNPADLRQALTVTGVYSGSVTLKMLNGAGVQIAGDFTVSGTIRTFTPAQNWLVGNNAVQAVQVVGGVLSDPSDLRTFTVAPYKPQAPIIDFPSRDQIIDLRSSFTGTQGYAGPGSRVALYVPNSEVELAHAIPPPNGGWRTSTEVPLGPGSHVIRVRVEVGSVHSDEVVQPFKVRPPVPEISSVPNPIRLRQALTIFNIYSGSVTLTMFDGANKPIDGNFTDAGTGGRIFTPRQDWVPGDNTAKVVQTVASVPSHASTLLRFKVRPPTPAITAPPYPAATRQALTITGVYSASATLKMLNGADGLVLGNFSISGTTATFTPAQNWSLGSNTVKVLQIMGGVESEASDLCVFSTQPLKLTILPPPGIAEPRQALIIVGVHADATMLKMFDFANNEVPGNFTPSGDRRTYTPNQNWQPGEQRVIAVQVVGGVELPPSDPCTFIVAPEKPQAPIIDSPLNGQLIDVGAPFSGRQGYFGPGSRVVLYAVQHETEMADATPGPDGNWTSSALFKSPGPHYLRVRVEVGKQRSDDVIRSFKIRPRVPVITSPPNPAAPDQRIIVSNILDSSGTLEMLDSTNRPIRGQFWPYGTFVKIFEPDKDWPLGDITVKAVLTLGLIPSHPSQPCTFKVVPPKLVITAPHDTDEPKQALTITGVYSLLAELTMIDGAGGQVTGTFTISGTSGTFTPDQDWPRGENTVKGVQTVSGVASEESDPFTFAVGRPKPQTPLIDFPEQDQIIDLNSTCSGTRGRPEAGAFVILLEPGTGHEWAYAMPGVDGHWISTTLPQGPGPHEIHVLVVAPSGDSDPVPLTFKIRPPKPAITPPPIPAELRQPLIITNVYSASASLVLFDGAEKPVYGTFTGSGADFIFTPDQDWARGENAVTVRQTEVGVESVPSDVCTFTVPQEEKPEAPQFELPLSGSRNPARPVVRVAGLPDALMTVRLEGGDTLHSASADEEGVLVFLVENPLQPGQNVLQVKQQVSGPESEWSEPHSFIVNQLPKTPGIDAPTNNSRTNRYPTIRGKAETRGEIHLCHADDPDTIIDRTNGVASWRMSAKQPWDVGHYSVQVRQADDGDSSPWSESRMFEVVDTKYMIGDAGPVLAQPVAGKNESVLLRAEVLSSDTWQGVEGLKVEWRIGDEPTVRATILTDRYGWAHYRYTPATPGEHRILADVTNENEGVVTTQLFDVTALEENSWEQPFSLYLNDQWIVPACGQLVLLPGTSYELKLGVNDDTQMGSTVTLENLADAVQHGLEFDPPLGTPQTITAGMARWSITAGAGSHGFFGLKLTSSRLPDWWLPGRVISVDLAEEVEVSFDTFATAFGRAAFPCRGATHTFTVRPKPDSRLLGEKVTLEWLGEAAADLGVVVSPDPAVPQTMGEDGVSWTFDCVNSSKDGTFTVQLKVPGWRFTSIPLTMSLAHNKVRITETFGPKEMGGSAPYYRYGVCVASAFTGQAAGGRPALLEVSGSEPVVRNTEVNGWIYVSYYEGQTASFTFVNPYDGSIASSASDA